MNLGGFKREVGSLAVNRIPFFFIIDFEMKKPFLCRLDETNRENIFYNVNGKGNFNQLNDKKLEKFEKYPVAKEEYHKGFNKAAYHINRGDTYLVNLTFPTRLETNLSLKELFHISSAPYKLFFKDEFVVFSPECFVKIKDDMIYSYPMKGTIDASVPEAEEKLINNKKEVFEHNTIVDLIRNDLSIIASGVKVTRFRYITRINTNQKDLLQVNSEISGKLENSWRQKLGHILIKMLPAGSISGAPKQKTVDIIRDAEQEDRGYFTGIFGIYDGTDLGSAVNIRFIEKTDRGLQFRSGGGITALSDPDSEYSELIDKVYVPAG
jgi:para-aminobenzoate synthetase component I